MPEPLRTQCLDSFLEWAKGEHAPPKNYEEWLYQAMGKVFSDNFPASYTRKYWTCEPRNLDVDWIGQRILRPEVDDVVNGAKGPLPKDMYYVGDRSPRYPSKGGFLSYCHKMAAGADIRYGMKMEQIDFGKQLLRFADGTEMSYGRLVSTVPLPYLIKCSTDAPDDVREAAGVAPVVAVLPGRRRREPSASTRRDLVLRLRRGQAQRSHQPHGALLAEQRAGRQDGDPGRGLRLRLATDADRPSRR